MIDNRVNDHIKQMREAMGKTKFIFAVTRGEKSKF